MATNIGPKIGVDGEKEYRQQISQIIQQSKTLASEMKLVSASFTTATTAEEKNAKTAAVLNKQIAAQRQYVAALAAQAGKAAATYGTNSVQAQKYEEQLNKARAKLLEMQHALQDTERGVDDLGKEMDNGGQKALSFGDLVKSNLASEAIIGGVKLMASAIKEAAEELVDLSKQAIQGFAEQEQLIGGVDTLFKTSSKQVQQYANEAYKTAGLSANEYMETVTSFSASLLQSLGGDTARAAAYADRAVTDMSDNANKMGTNMASIQDAYQGFAKQNYTMLDNLKLGYGGTKTEMERLIADASAMTAEQEKLNVAVDAGDLSFGNIVNAISVMQEHLGIAGTTAEEAEKTIEGSAKAMKSAWQNLVTGMADENLDLSALIDNFVESIQTFLDDNLIPRIQTMLPRMVEALTQLIGAMTPYIAPALQMLLPVIVQGISALVSGIVQALPAVVSAISNVIPMIVDQLVVLLPQITASGVEIISALVSGIGENLPALIPAAVDAIIELASTLVANVDKIVLAAGDLIGGLIQGLFGSLGHLIYRVPEIIAAIVAALMKGMVSIVEVGGDIVRGLWNGIKNMVGWLYNKVRGWASDIVGWIKGSLGIHSPSKVFADEIGKFIPPGITVGVEQAMPRALRDMGQELSALSNIPIPGSVTNTTHMGGVSITVYGAQGQDVNALANVIMYKMQSAVESREAVFA
nr:MAG TPA: tail tape measure protein [Caudoviricetes sp.]